MCPSPSFGGVQGWTALADICAHPLARPPHSARELSVIARLQSSLGDEKFGDMLGSQEPLAALFSLVLRA